MLPTLVDLGTWNLPLLGETRMFLPTYGVLLSIAVAASWYWFHRRAIALGADADGAFNLAFYTLLAGLVGAKLALVAVDFRWYLEDPSRILSTLRSAGVLLGGIAAGTAVFLLYARARGLPLAVLCDAIAPPVALGQAIGRLGCFSAGCCWGVPAGDSPLAIVFSSPEAAARTGVPLGIPLVPIQLLQAAADLGVVLLLVAIGRRRPAAGSVLAWYFVLYGIERAVLEHWRGDAARGLWLGGGVSTSQILSALAVIAGAAWLLRARRGRSPAE